MGGEVFEGMYRKIRVAAEHSHFEFFGEEAFVSNFGQGHIEDVVPLGTHGVNVKLVTGVGFLQAIAHPVGLHEGELAFTGSDANGAIGGGHGRSHGFGC